MGLRRRLSARQVVWLDVVLAVLAASTGWWRDLGFPAGRFRMFDLPPWCYAGVQLLGAVTVLFRRRHPIGMVWINAGLCLITPTQASYLAVYSLGSQARHRVQAGVAFLLLVACWSVGAQQWRLVDPVSSLLLLLFGLILGLWVHARRTLLDSLTERAERAEREQMLAAELAMVHDRARLAADVHDTVGHWISLMVLQAGALEVTSTDERTRRAAGAIQSHGGQAIAELRGLLEAFRTDELGGPATDLGDPSAAVNPSLAGLIDRAREAGLSVTVHSRGRPLGHDDPLTGTAYRIVQEGLTNASRHAAGSRVVVVIDRQSPDTVVEVTTSGPEPGAAPTVDGGLICDTQSRGGAPGVVGASDGGGGTGLIGLRRRVAALHGKLDAEALGGGGFRIRAVLPAPTDERGPVR